ncbi:MAG: 16S rRNA (cytosine(1402)-N(4))-methyltransferase RsmH [Bacteroidaceae bacterium]|nr:16S rRNA (cytosine(1402)-N(4))-methyltransferase RsmH [Bacteroidaceae bacterium]
MSEDYHIPVLLQQSVDGLNIHEDGVYVDATFGGGGHSREIMRRLNGKGRLFGFDQDIDAFNNFISQSNNEADFCSGFQFVRSNFRYMANFLRFYGVDKADGILADLGVSSHHFDESGRGFSFRFEGELDMRMNQRGGITAADVVNTYDEKRIADILFIYGELKNSRRMADAIVKARKNEPIRRIEQLVAVLEPFMQRQRVKKDMAKAFQAFRIEVNHEMDALREMLQQTTRILKPGGRLVVITYHSLEDKLVKNLMRTGNCEGVEEKDFYGNCLTPFQLVNRKVIVPDTQEQERNPRSRSAKLRIAELKG